MILENPTEQQYVDSVRENPYTVRFIKNPSKQVQNIAVTLAPHSLHYIDNPDPDIEIKAVRLNNSAITNIKDYGRLAAILNMFPEAWKYVPIELQTQELELLMKLL